MRGLQNDHMTRPITRVLTSVWLIALIALGLRAGYAWDQQRHVSEDELIGRFAGETGNIAASVAMGRGYASPMGRVSGPTAVLPPVYPLIVAGIFRIFGIETIRSFYAATFLNMLFSAGACVPIFYAGKRIAGLGVGAGAAWLWALLPNAIVFPFEWIWDTSLSALLAALLLWATLAVAESSRWRDWCAYGVLWGFTLLTNPSVAAVLPFLVGWAAYRAHGRGLIRLQHPAIALVCAVALCIPWSLRNYVVFHKFVPLRSDLGLKLYIGNNENYGPHPPVWPHNITRGRELYRFFRMGEMAFMQEEMHKALVFMRDNPGIEVRLCGERVVAFWMGTHDPLRGFLETDSLFLRVVSVCSLLLTLGTLAGIFVLLVARSPFALPVLSFPMMFPLVYYVTDANLRYRHPLDPILVLLCAVVGGALVRWVGSLPKRPGAQSVSRNR